jgi:predicted aspartyl protease
MTALAFDRRFDPPAPVLLVRITGSERHGPAVALRMLVDTGADCSLIPLPIALSLGLPLVDRVQIQGVAAGRHMASVFAARVHIGRFVKLARLVAFGDEALLGRDLLNQLVLRIDGPAQSITIVRRRGSTRS